MAKYTVGMDFGTLSARAVVADTANGRILSGAEFVYPHGVMDARLPDGAPLPLDYALQHPRDYLDALSAAIPEAVRKSGVDPADVVGIGIDFTACTVLPVDAAGTPLCLLPEWEHSPHAYVKLWKHHAAQGLAHRIADIARQRGEEWLSLYGGEVSSEWNLPKLWEVLEEAPELYRAMYAWVEAGDWIVWQLTGRLTQNACAAGYKSFYRKGKGFPSQDFYAAIDPRLQNVIAEKCFAPVVDLGTRVGGLTDAMAQSLGLRPGIAVAAANVDAHVCVPAAGLTQPGQMLAIMGTSSCHMMLSHTVRAVPGMCGMVQDGLIPGFLGYEAGQSCVGDHFAWFCDRCVPARYQEEARRQGVNIHQYLTELAQKLRPGESGLLALDWWNGNRSVLVDIDLSGLMLGMTLQTKPEEMYRALIEATAYGARKIVENYRACGVPVTAFFATGGISQKNPMAMQIYADVLNMPVRIVDASQGAALGSAIFGAVAAGSADGGYDDVISAIQAMSAPSVKTYEPIPENAAAYERLYREYEALHDYFGRGQNPVMKTLKAIKQGE